MEYIVLISDGIYKHDFKLFATEQEANDCATRAKLYHKTVIVNKLAKPVEL